LFERHSVKRALVELGIIVLGVGLALAADSWREGLADRRTEREYLQRLRLELEAGRVPIAANLARVTRSNAALDTLLPLATRAPLTDSATFVRVALVAANYTFNPSGIVHDLTYREMSATGSLNLIRDSGLRMRLTDYYRQAYRTGDASQETPRAYSDRVGALIGLPAGTGTTPEDNRSGVVADLDNADRLRLITHLRADPGVPDELRLLRGYLINERGWMERLLAATDSLVASLPGID